MKNKAAVALGKRRWAGSSAAERKAFSEQGSAKGGKAAWEGMSEEDRSAEMKRRRAKGRKKSKSKEEDP